MFLPPFLIMEAVDHVFICIIAFSWWNSQPAMTSDSIDVDQDHDDAVWYPEAICALPVLQFIL